jgi:hypothetical protein
MLTGVTARGNPLLWSILLLLLRFFMLATRLVQVGKGGGQQVDLLADRHDRCGRDRRPDGSELAAAG